MYFFQKGINIRKVIIVVSFIIVLLIVWNTYSFFQIFKKEERFKMELWANAQKTLQNANENTDVEIPFQIISNNKTIPMFLVDENDKIINHNNIDENITKDSITLLKYFKKIKSDNEPIKMELSQGSYQYIYYANSSLINKLKYYPIALLLIIILFATVIYNFYRTSKIAVQNKLWAGMAKETAHQIGTPLSSLIGWLELLKIKPANDEAILEIEKDVNRLNVIADRFSKIGSEPKLEKKDIVEETKHTFNYLKDRSSHMINFVFKSPNIPCYVNINSTLHSWTIENLIKNGIDAMKGKGTISIVIEAIEDKIKIKVKDTGKGISKKNIKKVFEPGFTTKKRGWGLGLSLTKRIVEDYHKGNIKVSYTEENKGTEFTIIYNLS